MKKVVSFSGGWQSDCPDFNAAKFEEFGRKIKAPVVSLYGSNDSAWGQKQMEANLAALKKGGKAIGQILPGPGHNLFETHPDRWTPIVFPK